MGLILPPGEQEEGRREGASVSEDAKILAYMEEHGSITPAEAYSIAGCLAMHSAAARLRKAGYAVHCVMRYGAEKKWGEYFLGVAYG